MSMTEAGTYHIAKPLVEPSASDFVLDSYLMHIRTNRCSCCNAIEQWSEIHEVRVHRHNGTRQLRPTAAPDRNYPIGISRLPVRELAVCHCCVLSTEPLARDLSSHNAQVEWAQTLSRKYAPAPKAPDTAIAAAMTRASSAKAPRPIADLEDL